MTHHIANNVSHIANAAGEHHPAPAPHGHGFIDSIIHGFGWRFGSDAANSLFHSAPGFFTMIILVGLLTVGGVWLYKKFGARNSD